MGTITVRESIWNYYRTECKYSGGRRPTQQVIRARGKSVVFCGRGKHTEMTSDITDCLCAHAHLPVGGDAEREGGRQGERLG